MSMYRTSRTFDVVFLAAMVALVACAVIWRVHIGDWLFFLWYRPPAEVVQVADEAGLSEVGRRMFYRTDPQFVNREQMAAECDIERLGCINEHGRVFILDAESGNHDQAVVTAAHEMLHLVYRRMTGHEREVLGPLIDEGIRRNETEGLADELKDETDHDDRRDEAHSLLGSEYRNLPDGLERYYRHYFDDRSKVVGAEARSERQID